MPLNSKEVKEAGQNVFTYLNSIDLSPYLKKYKHHSVGDIMAELENDFLYKDEYSKTLFDVVNENEFIDYLKEKYNIKTRETTITFNYIY